MTEVALVFYLIVGGVALARYLLLRGQPPSGDDWPAAAAGCGLVVVPQAGGWSWRKVAALEGRWDQHPLAETDRLRITLSASRGEDGQTLRHIVVARRDRPARALWIEVPELGHFTQNSLTTGGTATGDSAFDGAATLLGPSSPLLAVLDASTRASLITLARSGPVVIVEGEVQVTIDERHLEMSRQRLLALLIAVSDRVHSEIDLASALAHNARSDPHPGARERNLEELARNFRETAGTSETLRAALADEAPEVQIRAAQELGEEGRPFLLRFAEDPDAGDAIAAAAIVALGGHFAMVQVDRALKLALRRRHLGTATACIERLGLGDIPEAAATLGRILRVDRGPLAIAAARALGHLAGEPAEAHLIAALAGESAEIALEVVEALGRSGSIAAIPALHSVVERSRSARRLQRAARQAIAAIQARVPGAEHGQLSLAPTLGGSISLAPERRGQISLAQADTAGQISNPEPPTSG